MMLLEELGIRTLQAQETTPAPAPAASKGGAFGMFLPMILVFAIFYLLLIRPQAKQRKLHQSLVTNLKRGDEVVTTSGIHGKVTGIADNLVTLEIAENVRIKLEKQQVSTVKQSAS